MTYPLLLLLTIGAGVGGGPDSRHSIDDTLYCRSIDYYLILVLSCRETRHDLHLAVLARSSLSSAPDCRESSNQMDSMLIATTAPHCEFNRN
jgi:hypothetical protein